MQSQLHWVINIHARVTIINLIKDQRLLGIHLFIRTFQPAKSSAWSHRLNKQNYTSQTIQYLDFIKKNIPVSLTYHPLKDNVQMCSIIPQ